MNVSLKRHKPEIVVILTLVAMFSAVIFASAADDQTNVIDLSKPIATVNGVDIPYSMFYNMIEAKVGLETLQNLVIYEVVKQKAEELGIEVTDADIDRELQSIIYFQFNSENEFYQEIQNARLTMGEVRSQIWNDLVRREIAKREVDVTEDEVKAFFDENKESMYDIGERVEVRQILTKTKDEAQSIVDSLKSGGSFESLAAEKSLDAATKDNGGYVGKVPKGLMIEEWENAVFSAKKGDIVGPVETDLGYFVIEVLDKLPPQKATFEDYKDVAESDLKASKARSTDAILIDLMAEANVTILDPNYKSLEDLINQIKASSASDGTEQLPAGAQEDNPLDPAPLETLEQTTTE